MLTFPHQTERENVDGQAEADIAGRGPDRRAEKIAAAQKRHPQDNSQIDIAKTLKAASPHARLPQQNHRAVRSSVSPSATIATRISVANGLRRYAHYRDLGIAAASHGLAQAHVIRLIGPCNPAEVSKLHFHDVEFQLVYVLKGWVKTYMEGQGETLMKEGSCWTQPPRIKHLILDYSDNCELLEVILPAEFRTVELAT